MYLQTLLKGVGLDPKQCKIVKHSGERFERVKDKYFIAYQSCQPKKTTKWNFCNCKYLIAFGGTKTSHTASLIGCYEMLDEPATISIKQMPDGYLYPDEYIKDTNIYYPMKAIANEELDSLKGRLIIEWNGRDGVRNSDYLVKILSIQNPEDIFPGYDKLTIMYNDLKAKIGKDNIKNFPNWKAALDIYAIYLLTDITNGKQYVGSATEEEGGLFNRWSHYINDGIDNDLTNKVPAENFQFSILEILSKREVKNVIEKEYNWMRRLYSYAPYGYNNNSH